jgi:TPR repeat protein
VGDVEAEGNLGTIYMHDSDDMKKNYTKAAYYFMKSAKVFNILIKNK